MNPASSSPEDADTSYPEGSVEDLGDTRTIWVPDVLSSQAQLTFETHGLTGIILLGTYFDKAVFLAPDDETTDAGVELVIAHQLYQAVIPDALR